MQQISIKKSVLLHQTPQGESNLFKEEHAGMTTAEKHQLYELSVGDEDILIIAEEDQAALIVFDEVVERVYIHSLGPDELYAWRIRVGDNGKHIWEYVKSLGHEPMAVSPEQREEVLAVVSFLNENKKLAVAETDSVPADDMNEGTMSFPVDTEKTISETPVLPGAEENAPAVDSDFKKDVEEILEKEVTKTNEKTIPAGFDFNLASPVPFPSKSFSKSLQVEDYESTDMKIALSVLSETKLKLADAAHNDQHEHRKWEYGIALLSVSSCQGDLWAAQQMKGDPNPLRENQIVILDVGGAGSLLGAALVDLGYDLLQIDPADHSAAIAAQAAKLEKSMAFAQQDFLQYQGPLVDVVLCMSVIEHTADDLGFVRKLGSHVKPGGLLVLTMDFHPSGVRQTPWHERAYNEKGILNLYAELPGFEIYGGQFNYKNYEQVVHEWSFASLVMRKL